MRLDRDPASMTAEERRHEVQEILGRGVLRAVLISRGERPNSCPEALTEVRPQSDECATRTAGSKQ